MRSRRTKPGEGRGSDERSQLDGRRVRADEAARVAGFGKGEQRNGRGPRRKEPSNGQQARAEKANTTGGVRAREASSVDGLDGPTMASSDEPGRRRQHDELRIRTDTAVRGMARPGERSQREGLGRKSRAGADRAKRS